MSHLGTLRRVAKGVQGHGPIAAVIGGGSILAGGLVEVVCRPAHYFMGGGPSARPIPRPSGRGCSSPVRTRGGMHGAKSPGAATASPNSTVFRRAIAGGCHCPRWIAANGGHRAPDEARAGGRRVGPLAQHPFSRKAGEFERVCGKKLLDTMWDDCPAWYRGPAARLERGHCGAGGLIEGRALGGPAWRERRQRPSNMGTWHDWLNLRSPHRDQPGDCAGGRAKGRENSRAARTSARDFSGGRAILP